MHGYIYQCLVAELLSVCLYICYIAGVLQYSGIPLQFCLYFVEAETQIKQPWTLVTVESSMQEDFMKAEPMSFPLMPNYPRAMQK